MLSSKQIFIIFLLLILFVKNSYAEDTGTASAPADPTNTRIIIVNGAGGDNYTTIQAAVNAYQAGDTIQVKNGTYIEAVDITNKDCTSSAVCTIMAFSGHFPIIDPFGTGLGSASDPTKTGIELVGSSWWLFEGLEIKGGYYAIRLTQSPNNTIRKNTLHASAYSGILADQGSHEYIADNTIYANGTSSNQCLLRSTGACTSPTSGGADDCERQAFHCHGIYISQDYGSFTAIGSNTVRRNYIYSHNGACITMGDDTNLANDNNLIEGNLCINDQLGLYFDQSFRGANIIRNNTIVINSPYQLPVTDLHGEVYYILLGIEYLRSGTANIWRNNILYASGNSFFSKPVYALRTVNSNDNLSDVDYNLWQVPAGTQWIRTNVWQNSNFNGTYKSTTGWDTNGPTVPTDPLFVNISQNNFDIQASSPAINVGVNAQCSALDFHLISRPQQTTCDIGAYEKTSTGASPNAPTSLTAVDTPSDAGGSIDLAWTVSTSGAACDINTDTFTEGADTALETHTSDCGSSWTGFNTTSFQVLAASDELALETTSGDGTHMYGAGNETLTSADYWAEVVGKTGGSGTNDRFGVAVRLAAGVDGYVMFVVGSGGDTYIYRVDDSAYTQLGSTYTIPSFSTSTTYTVRLKITGSTIKGYVDGIERISATDATYSAAGVLAAYMMVVDDAAQLPRITSFDSEYVGAGGGSAVDEQRLYRSTISGGPYSLVTTFLNNTTASYSNTGLTNGTTYYYVIRAFDTGIGESQNSNEAFATPDDEVPPDPPTNISARDRASDNGTAIILSWLNSPTGGVTQQLIYCDTTGTPTTLITTISDNTTTTYTYSGLTSGITYFCRMRAYDGSAYSFYTGDASATAINNGEGRSSASTRSSATRSGAGARAARQ